MSTGSGIAFGDVEHAYTRERLKLAHFRPCNVIIRVIVYVQIVSR